MLHTKYPQHANIPSLTSVSYLYSKENNPALHYCAQMWRAAALQISQGTDRFKKHAVATIAKKRDDTSSSARQIWQQLFLDFFAEESSQSLTSLAFIIVDGLDEAPHEGRKKFLNCLAELVGRSANNRTYRVQVAVFARPDIGADPGFENLGFLTRQPVIEVTSDRNTLDVAAFVRQRLSDVSLLKRLKKNNPIEHQSLAKEIYDSVQCKSRGMFL